MNGENETSYLKLWRSPFQIACGRGLQHRAFTELGDFCYSTYPMKFTFYYKP